MNDDPPFLNVGTEVSAKYKGAFCEAKVHKVVKTIKCRVQFKFGLGSAVVSDECIRGSLRVGAQVEAKHPEKNQFLEAVVNKIQDCSQYTVVFDDGDITTLRRTALCLKSGRHFAESETLDQLPLTHPEHFGTPVGGNRRGRRSQLFDGESDDDDLETSSKDGSQSEEREADVGKVVCVEMGERKKAKDNWFPGLVVAPTAQDQVPIRVKEEYLVRSFKDGRYYTVPKSEATEFSFDCYSTIENAQLKQAVENAMTFLESDELPPHWDRKVLFGVEAEAENTEASDDSDSDDEAPETKDHFVAQLYKHMDDRGTPINKEPMIGTKDLDLYRLFKIVHKMGGFNRVTNQNGWKTVVTKMTLGGNMNAVSSQLKQAYKKYLFSFEDFYRKLGVTLLNSPRTNRTAGRTRPGRSLMRGLPKKLVPEKSSTPVGDGEKSGEPQQEVSERAEESPSPKRKPKDDSDEKAQRLNKSEGPRLPKRTPKTPKSPTEKRRRTKSASESKAPKVGSVKQKTPRSGQAQKLSETPSGPPKSKQPKGEVSDVASKLKKSKSEPKLSKDDEGAKTETPKNEAPKVETKSETRPPRRVSPSKIASKKSESDDESDDTPRKRRLLQRSSSITAGDSVEKKKTRKKKLIPDSDTSTSEASEMPRKKVRRPVPPAEGVSPLPETEERAASRLRRSKTRTEEPKTKDDSDGETAEGELPKNVDVQLNDKLRVYYGNTQGTVYEAKVTDVRIENDVEMYLVHYTGWNTRYDEWITRQRIAENLSWAPFRKRIPVSRIRSESSSRRGRTSLGRSPQPGSRSGTPSSITSTTSSQSAIEKPKKADSPKTKDDRKDETTSAASDSSDEDSNLSGSESDSDQNREDTPVNDEPRTNEFDLRKIQAELKLTPSKVIRSEAEFDLKRIQSELQNSPTKLPDPKPGPSTPAAPETTPQSKPQTAAAAPVTRASPRRAPVRKKLLDEPPSQNPPTPVKSESNDIYEFSEPEPFKLEIRTKRLSSPIYDERNPERKPNVSGSESDAVPPTEQPKSKSPPEKPKTAAPKFEQRFGPVEFKQEPYAAFRTGILAIPRPEPHKEAKQVFRVDYVHKDIRPGTAPQLPEVKCAVRSVSAVVTDVRPPQNQALSHLSAFATVRPTAPDVKPDIERVQNRIPDPKPDTERSNRTPEVRQESERIRSRTPDMKPDPDRHPVPSPVPALNLKMENPVPESVQKQAEQKTVAAHRNAQPGKPEASPFQRIQSPELKPNIVQPTPEPGRREPDIRPVMVSPKPEPMPPVDRKPEIMMVREIGSPMDTCERKPSTSPMEDRKPSPSPAPDRKPVLPESGPPDPVQKEVKPEIGIISENIVKSPEVKPEGKELLDIPLATSLLPVIKLEVEVEKVVNIVKPEIKEEPEKPPEPDSAPIVAPVPLKKEPSLDAVSTESVPESTKTEPEEPPKKRRKRPTRKPVRSSEYIEFSDSESSSDDSLSKLTIDIREEPSQPSSVSEADPPVPEFDESSVLLCEETIPGSPEAPPCPEDPPPPVSEPPPLFVPTVSASQEDIPPPPVKKAGPKLRPVLIEERPKQGPKFRARPVVVDSFDSGTTLGQNTPPTSPDTSASTLSSPKSSPKSDNGEGPSTEFIVRHDDTEVSSSSRPRDDLTKRGPNQRRSYAFPLPNPAKKSSRSGSLGPGRSPRRTGLHEDCPDPPEPRMSRYNFIVDLAPEMDPAQRISILQEKMKQIRKVYADLKAEVASIDRRRKKIKKKEKSSSSQ